MSTIEKPFVSSKMEGRSPFGNTWEELRDEVRDQLERCGIDAWALEKETPDPRDVRAVFAYAADDCTAYIGLWGSEYSSGTIDEYLRSLEKPRYIYLLDCAANEALRSNAPNDPETRRKLRRLDETLDSISRSAYPVRSQEDLLAGLSNAAARLLARARWTTPHVFDPDVFVGRGPELATCRHVITKCANRSGVVTVSAISSTGKTALLRRLGYELTLSSLAEPTLRPIADLDCGASPGEVMATLLQQLGAADPTLDLIGGGAGSPARAWSDALAVGVGGAFVDRLIETIADLIRSAFVAPLILLDDVHKIRDPVLIALWKGVLAREDLGLTLVCAWRSDELAAYGESEELRSALSTASRRRAPNAGAQIRLAGFESPQLVGQFFERRGLGAFLTPSVRLDKFIESPPGDLAEFADQLRAGTVDSLDPTLFKPNVVNSLRWDRLADFRDDLRILSAATDGAPEHLLQTVARATSYPLRLSYLAETGTAIPVRRPSGTWYRLYPDQFSDYVFTTHVDARLRLRLQSAVIASGLADIRAGAGPDIADLLIRVIERAADTRARVEWSAKLGEAASLRGWITKSLAAFRPLIDEANYGALRSRRVEFLLDCVDLHRQSGDRENALQLLTRVERRCSLSPSQTIRAACLRMRMARDLKGGEAARRIARRLMTTSPVVLSSYEFLNQLARIARDTGRIAEGLQHARDANKAVARAGRSNRVWVAKAEIMYTAGSIERLAGLFKDGTKSLMGSRRIREAREDKQGGAYVLLELAMCALVQDRHREAADFVREARELSSDPQVSDRRAQSFADSIGSCLALVDGNLVLAQESLNSAAEWTSTREQGIRGNPGVIRAVILARTGRTSDATEALNPLLSSDDRTVQATAAILLATISRRRRTEMTAKARALAARNGFSLQGVGAELLGRLCGPTA